MTTRTVASYSFEEIEGVIDETIKKFLEHDKQLLELCVDERASTHRIACYLENFFDNSWHVDCEYNRKGRDPKRQNGGLVRPDIIVHRRYTCDNLLCVEVKKCGEILANDRKKLREFTNNNGEYRYRFGLLLLISLEDPYSINGRWYRKGVVNTQWIEYPKKVD
ncbi:MAG: hypothetical protein WC379_10445 [Methanoregula sp.]|jgi:hypothetical protein